MAALKVITANYMREYDRIKQFCEDHKADLKTCYKFSQTKKVEALCEKERQIFELEERLKELFDVKTDPHRHSKVKVEISREDLVKLSKWCQGQKNENFFEVKIPLSDEIINSHERREYNIRRYFGPQCKGELKALSKLCEEAEQENKNSDSDKRKFIELGKTLENAYKKETEEVNKEKFSCIRRSVIPACYFPILYRHFFVEDDSKYSDIKTVNKFLYRALKLEDNDKYCIFVPETLSIGLRKKAETIKNYHVDSFGKFSAFKRDRYGSLLHELMHFMNRIDSFDGAKESVDIDLDPWSTDIIENTKVVSELEFSKEDIYPKKEKKENEEDEEEYNGKDNREFTDKELGDIREKLEKTLGDDVYDDACETWTMYGIFICQDKQNPGKYEFYYDPINEAVADSECKIIGVEEKQVVRTGHCCTLDDDDDDDDDQNRIDSEDETSLLAIEVLDKKIDIYQFYFNKGETLRDLINK